MALTNARAVAAFNPTAPSPGFLQPLFLGSVGDNRSYVQVFSSPDRLDEFAEIGWPDRDFIWLAKDLRADIGREPLWGFLFPDGESLVAPWSEFRTLMAKRVDDPQLTLKPLLLFDIVDTLNLEEAKEAVFKRAFLAYVEMGREGAERWRDRAILEPALIEALSAEGAAVEGNRSSGGARLGSGRLSPTIRARIDGSEVTVQFDGIDGDVQQRTIKRAYNRLVHRFPDLFPPRAAITTTPPPRKSGGSPREASDLTIVLVGRLADGRTNPGDWGDRGIEITDDTRYHPALRTRGPASVTVLLGAQQDWSALIDASRRVDGDPAVIVVLSNYAIPLLRDLEFQAGTNMPTVTFFAPHATSAMRGGDPVEMVRGLLEFIRRRSDGDSAFDIHRLFRAQHNVLMREPMWASQSGLEVACRLAARAFRSGAVLDGPARLFGQGAVTESDLKRWNDDFSNFFSMSHDRLVTIDGRRATLLLIAERTSRTQSQEQQDRQRDAVMRLFDLRGWRVRDEGDGLGGAFRIEGGGRNFGVIVVDRPRSSPSEQRGAPAPGLTRAALLVVHIGTRREQLLKANRGQFLHVVIEDIALIDPETPWVWRIIARQLFGSGARPSEATLRLCAALVVEAVQHGPVPRSGSAEVDWKLISQIAASPDNERFVSFAEPRLSDGASLAFRLGERTTSMTERLVLKLRVEDHGPIIVGVEASQFAD